MIGSALRGARSIRGLLMVMAAVAFALVLAVWMALDVPLRLKARGGSTLDAAAHDPARVARMREVIEELAAMEERVTHEAQETTASLLDARLAALGYEPWLQRYEYEGETWTNVIASQTPLASGTDILVLMAHLDSLGWGRPPRAPGADDNGSGLAVLLEIARAFRGVDTGLPLVICFFSNEEVGLRGSRAFVTWAVENDISIQAAINVDVVGYGRPAELIDMGAIRAQGWPRARLRSVTTQFRNALKAYGNGAHTLRVAGKPRHADLVRDVSMALADGPRLEVAPKVGDDCG